MTDLQQSERTGQRPVTVILAAVLTALVAVLLVAQTTFVFSLPTSLGMAVAIVVGGVATAACWAVTVPGLLRARSWAQVTVTALAVVTAAQGLPGVVTGLVHIPDPALLAYTVALLAPVAIVVLLWTPRARAWFGPVR